MAEPDDRGIEQFPVEKKQIRFEEPPELIFFDVDEESEEAEFIRVDDLFAMEPETGLSLTGLMAFTLFPRKKENVLSSHMSRLLQRTLILSAAHFEKTLEKVRVRPQFLQWQIELTDVDKAEEIAGEFRDALEAQVQTNRKGPDTEPFWSPNCFVCPVDKEFSDEMIVKIAEKYQI